MKIKILSLNLCDLPIPTRSGILKFSRKERFQELINQLGKSDFDIICFQELFTKITLHLITNALPNHKPIYTDYFGLNKGGLVIFINKSFKAIEYEFKTFKNIKLLPATLPDILIHKGFQILKTDAFTIINTHLIESYNIKSVIKIQPKQLKEIHDNIDERSIICGDFNVTKQIQKEFFIDLNDALDGIHEPTITDRNPNRFFTKIFKPLNEQYDNIYFSKEFKKIKSSVYFKGNNQKDTQNIIISDHYGVFAELELNTQN